MSKFATNGSPCASAVPRPAEKRYWPEYPEYAYDWAEWTEFVRELHPDFTPALVVEETKRLWNMAKSRLCDQPQTPWKEVMDLREEQGAIIVVISASRAYVTDLKPALHRDGIVATFGRPGDAMTGLRGRDPNSWTYPWMAKTVGAVSAVVYDRLYKEPSVPPRVTMVLLNAAMETGSQMEWEALETVKSKIFLETAGVDLTMTEVVVDAQDILQYYALDPAELSAKYYRNCKKVTFIRHAESEANIHGDMMNPALTAAGVHQAQTLGQKTFNTETLVVSPHIRTLQTWQHMSITCTHAIISSCVAELNRDEEQNILPERDGDLVRTAVPLAHKQACEVHSSTADGDLTNASLAAEALAFLEALPGSDVVVITHRVLIRELTDKDIGNCGVVYCMLEDGSIENVQIADRR